jgi:hypothetical protein
MAQNAQQITTSVRNSLESGQPSRQHSETSSTTSSLTEWELKQVNAFFALIRSAYPRQFDTEFGDVQVLNHAKRFWMRDILDLTQEQMDKGFKDLRKRRVQGDEDFKWPDIGRVIGLCRNAAKRDPAHKPFPKLDRLAPSREAKQVGREALSNLKAMVGL